MGQECRLETVDYYRGQSYSPLLEIGDNVHIENRVHIGCVNNIKISDNVLIIDHNHGYYDHAHEQLHENPFMVSPGDRILTEELSVVILKNVWLGENVVVLPGAVIGEGTIVGANSVVKGHLDSGSIYAGNPCRKIKYYDKVKSKWCQYEQ